MGAILDWVQKKLLGSYLSNAIRHALTALSAYLVTQGVDATTAGQFTESAQKIALQLLPVLIALLWSVVEKKTLKGMDAIK